MRVVMFCHSLISDWNPGDAHFLRGVATELIARNAEVCVYEPRAAWGARNLQQQRGTGVVGALRDAYPKLQSNRYELDALDLAAALEGTDVVLVHDRNEPALVQRIGRMRAAGGHFRLLFHDTHHRAATAPDEIARFDLRHYDGVLASSDVIRALYVERGWAARAWTWHEAADTRVFRPVERAGRDGDAILIGRLGDGERAAELQEYFVDPVRELGLRGTMYGVHCSGAARRAFAQAGIDCRGWQPSFEAPRAYAQHRVTVHVPQHARAAVGTPSMRVFEALACGIPLVSAPWTDRENMFRAGVDYLVAQDGAAMRRHLYDVVNDDALAATLARSGLRTILSRHTCAHRVDELLAIVRESQHAFMQEAVT